RVGAAHERDGARCVAALRQLLLRGAQARQVHARAGAAAEDDALAADPVEDRVHRILDREDEARGALRLLLEPDVEPDRRVEGGADLPLDLVEGVAARDREQTADGEAGALVDDAVRELVGIDLNGVCLLYGRHLGSFPTTNFRFPKACAAATASARRGVRN